MSGAAQRYALAALILVGLWVLVYWLWPAARVGEVGPGEAGVTFAGDPSGDRRGADPRLELAPSDTAQRPATQPQDDLVADTPPDAPEADTAPGPDAPAGPRKSEAPGTIPPRFTEYVVQRGDDMWSIAEKVYGDRDRWDAVAKANPTVDPQRLRAGQTLRIAVDPDNVQGVPADGAPPPPPDADPTEHIVAEGETLSEIAKTLYGRASLWRVIYGANRHLLDAPEDLRPGMRLLIPPAPSRAGS